MPPCVLITHNIDVSFSRLLPVDLVSDVDMLFQPKFIPEFIRSVNMFKKFF